MVKINYKSDFKINERSETVALEVPFVFSYYVFDNKKYVASFDGNTYINCERKEDGSLDVIFNSAGFGVGRLKVERKYAVDDKAFVDGVYDIVTVDKTDVFITSGKTFETYVETLVVPPYIKGDKGDPMTWSGMTKEEQAELVQEVTASTQEADLLEKVTGNEKISVSDGSGVPKAITTEQIKNYIEESKESSSLEFVDLGLPSGNLWATRNIGAEKSEDSGLFFAWGETEGYNVSYTEEGGQIVSTTIKDANGNLTERKFTFADYKWSNGAYNRLAKYNTNSSYGVVDNLTRLLTDDDAAYAVNNTYRIPSVADFEELIQYTTFSKVSIGSKKCGMFTAANGNYVIFPITGTVFEQISSVNSAVYYPTCEIYPSNPSTCKAMLISDYSELPLTDFNSRCTGLPVRAVKSKETGGGTYDDTEIKAQIKENADNIAANKADADAKLSELGSEVDDFKKTITNLTNAADEEDITSENGLLKFKNRNSLNGMGYVILRRNTSFAEQVTQSNTIYEIRYDFDLGGEEVTIPEGCTLKFEGGKLLNGILRLNYTTILNPFDGCFSNTYISKGGLYEYQNVFTNDVGLSSWFDGDDSNVIQSLASFRKVILTRDYNIINTNIYINHSFELNGQGHYLTIEKTRETEDETSYVFMSTVNPASDETSPSLNISISNINVVMRSAIFGEKTASATWGYRGVFLQAFGHNVVLDNVNINTNGTIITCWGYNDAVANRLGQLFVINSILKASMFIIEDPFKIATFTNSELSIDERDKFYYQDYVLSNMHDIVIDNCTVVGGIETKYRSGLGYSDIYVYNSILDYAFAIYSSDNKVNVTITGCVFRVLSKTAVNTNTNGKLRYWGGINVLSMERNLFDISFTDKYQMAIYLYGTVDNLSINYNTFQNIDNNGEEFEKIIHSRKAISSIVFIGNRIITNSAKIIIRIDTDYSDDNFINCKDNYINNPINTKLVINGTDRKDLSVMLFREERKGYTSGRPSVLTDLNRGYRYFDITQKLPIIWNGNRWILGDGFSPFRHSGWGGARPTGTNLDKTEDIGFYFFDRNLGKPIFISSISEEGVITWVDAMGAVVQ